MADLVEVSKALVARYAPVLPILPDSQQWETSWFPPLSPVVPAAFVRPDQGRFANYEQTLGPYTKWHVGIEFHVDATDEESAHALVGELVSKSGPIFAALRNDDIRDDLYDMCGLNISPTDGRGWRTSRRRRLSASIGVELGAN